MKALPLPRRRRVQANLRYLLALLTRFRITFLLAGLLWLGTPLIFRALFVYPGGGRIGFGEALHHVYFLMFGQPSLPYVDQPFLELLNLVIPPFSLAVVADGVVRFAFLFFAKHRSDKEWIEVISQTLRDHVVVCGAGRVGYRVVTQLLSLGREVVVIEKREDAQFVRVLRDSNIPVLIDDVRSPHCLERTHVTAASAIVCATDDDLANLNIALDARRMNPRIRVVMRLFDDDLGAKVRDAFQAETISSSAVAAPAMALAALDPRIVHSFQVSGLLMVVSPFVAGTALAGLTVGEVIQRFGGLTLALSRPGAQELLHPPATTAISRGDTLMVQAGYPDYLRLRDYTGEAAPPVSLPRGQASA